jgi:hypothetical protein
MSFLTQYPEVGAVGYFDLIEAVLVLVVEEPARLIE